MKALFKVLLSGLILSSSLPSFAATYFTSCDGLLSAINKGEIEKYFVNGVKNDGAATQLLRDYGVLLTNDFADALKVTLPKFGVRSPTFDTGPNPSSWRSTLVYLRGLRRVANFSPRKMQPLVWEVLHNLEDLTSRGPDPLIAQARHLQILRLLKAIETSDQKARFEAVVGSVIRSTLLITSHKLLTERIEKQTQKGVNLGTRALASFAAMVGGFALGLRGSTDLMQAMGLSPGTHEIEILLGALATSGGSLYLISRAFNLHSDLLEYQLSQVPESQRRLQLETPLGNPVIADVRGLLDPYDKDSSTDLISLQDACAASTLCYFTPAQIAYLGHVELLSLGVMKQEITDKLKSLGFMNNFKELRAAALAVRTNPDSYRDQVLFKGEVLRLTENFMILEQGLKASTDVLARKIGAFRPALEKLRDKPYVFSQQQLSADFINKNEMLLLKFESDLRVLETIQLDQNAMLRVLTRLKPTLTELGQILKAAQGSRSEWERLASEVIVELDAAQLEGARR
jgi:hypothetical protein